MKSDGQHPASHEYRGEVAGTRASQHTASWEAGRQRRRGTETAGGAASILAALDGRRNALSADEPASNDHRCLQSLRRQTLAHAGGKALHICIMSSIPRLLVLLSIALCTFQAPA